MLLASVAGVALLLAGDAGYRAQFLGGTVAALPEKAEGRIKLADEQVLVLEVRKTSLRVPYRRIEALEYGQRVSRRYAEAVLISPLLLLSKSRKHYLTVAFRDERGNHQAVVLRVGKGDVRPVLAILEARSGRRVDYQDDEARKSGKG